MFYVYEYYIVDTDEIFYVGKGTRYRYKDLKHRNEYFMNVYNKYNCAVRIIAKDLTNEEAITLEIERIAELKAVGQAKTNLTLGGDGFSHGYLNPTYQRDHRGKNNVFYGKKHTEETKRKISENRKGKGGQFGKDNPMYGMQRFGKDNPMYGRRGTSHPNAQLFKVEYTDGTTEILTHSQCDKKFGIGFTRIHKTGGLVMYKKESKNIKYTGTKITKLEQNV